MQRGMGAEEQAAKRVYTRLSQPHNSNFFTSGRSNEDHKEASGFYHHVI